MVCLHVYIITVNAKHHYKRSVDKQQQHQVIHTPHGTPYSDLTLTTYLWPSLSPKMTSTRSSLRKPFRVAQLLLLLLWVSVTSGQETPFVSVNKFDRSTSYRTNVCDRQRLLWNNSLELPDALQGLDLTVAITDYNFGTPEDAFFSLDNERRIRHYQSDYPGIFCVVLDEVARRAGFTWRNSFAVYEPLDPATDGNKTWTDILEWAVDTFDISMEKWGRSADRLAMGIAFPAGWYDSSITLVERFDESTQYKRVVDLWSFLKPFSSSVWIAICGAIIFSGLLYWGLEKLNTNADSRALDEKPIASIFYAATTFTGHFDFQPNTNAARLFGFSWTFWALVVGSAYTANLASFLVSPTIEDYRISSIEDAIALNASICVQGGAVIDSILSKDYSQLHFVRKKSEQAIFEALRVDRKEGGCDAVAHQYNTYSVYKRSKEVNFDCSLKSEERIIHPIPAGMATAIDTGVFCTSLISHVIDYHLAEMLSDGFLEKAWNNHVNRLATIECIDKPGFSGGGDDDTFSLGMQDVGGIFILHIVLSATAVMMAFVQFRLDSRKQGSGVLPGLAGNRKPLQRKSTSAVSSSFGGN